MMNRVVLAVLLFVVLSSFQTASTASDNSLQPGNAAEERVLISQEKAIWEAIRTKDIEKVKSFLAPDYAAVYPFGVRDLKGELDDTAKGYLVKFSMEAPRLTHSSSTLAVLLYKANATIIEKGQEKAVSANEATVWVKRDNTWKVVFHTSVPITN